MKLYENTTDIQLSGEVWKSVRDYENYYQVSNLGRVKSLHFKKPRIMKQTMDKDGYLNIGFKVKGKHKTFKVHRLVAQAFITNNQDYPEINHKNCKTDCNLISNLEWCTREYNNSYDERAKKIAYSKLKPIRVIKDGLGLVFLSVRNCNMYIQNKSNSNFYRCVDTDKTLNNYSLKTIPNNFSIECCEP